jgi:hypothetical protein
MDRAAEVSKTLRTTASVLTTEWLRIASSVLSPDVGASMWPQAACMNSSHVLLYLATSHNDEMRRTADRDRRAKAMRALGRSRRRTRRGLPAWLQPERGSRQIDTGRAVAEPTP